MAVDIFCSHYFLVDDMNKDLCTQFKQTLDSQLAPVTVAAWVVAIILMMFALGFVAVLCFVVLL